jgi:RNA polymerase sigma-70 factor (ECF subfamily)
VRIESELAAESFEQLAMPHFEPLYNFACWLARDRHEAEDLVQETYIKALNGFSSFQPGTSFRAWIYRILRNAFLSSHTGLKATATVQFDLKDEEEVLPAVTGTPESILLQRSEAKLVRLALEQLPVPYREVPLLCEVEEMSYQEISATFAIPMGTVMSRLSRNIVLVHGAWADGSGWKAVYDILVKDRYNVSIVQEPESNTSRSRGRPSLKP